MSFEAQIGRSVAYLGSNEARLSLEANCYWPKWHAPWWHMLLLHEMGETTRIPQIAIKGLIESIKRMPLKIFPIQPHDVPAGVRLDLDTGCHCEMGNFYGKSTFERTAGGEWSHGRSQASVFPLLNAVSAVGDYSPYLSWQWQTTQRRLRDLT